MKTSSSLDKLLPALLAAQEKFGPVVKDKVAKVKMRSGGEFAYKYANLASVLDAVAKPLRDNKLVLIQGVRQDNPGYITVESMLFHESGEFISEATTMPVLDPGPQAVGSAITYCRRYGATALLGLAPDEDDDAKLAQDLTEKMESRNTATQVARDEYSALDADMRAWVDDLVGRIVILLSKGDVAGAVAELETKEIDGDTKLAIWSRLDSKQRAAIKKRQTDHKAKEPA